MSKRLTDVYEITCECDENLLLEQINNMTNYYLEPEVVSPIMLLEDGYIPNDYNIEFDPDWALDLINAPGAWEICRGMAEIEIGITDSNYDFAHEELVGAINTVGPNITNSNIDHGTAVAITASGNTDNNVGKSSIGFGTKLNVYGLGYNNILRAAEDGSRVINISWASGCTFNSYHQDVINEVYDMGVLLVAAAGNGGTCGGPTNYVYPAAYDNVLAVSSVDDDDRHSPDAFITHQHNDKVDIVAPGYGVPIATSSYGYISSSGTSFAAPFVSGTAALLLSVDPTLTPEELTNFIIYSADDISAKNPGFDGLIGHGRLNARQAMYDAYFFSQFNMAIIDYQDTGNNPVEVSNNPLPWDCEAIATIPQLKDFSGVLFYEWTNLNTGETYSGDTITGLCNGDYVVSITHSCIGPLSTTCCPIVFYVGSDISMEDIDYPEGLVVDNPNVDIEDITGDGRILIRGPVRLEKNTKYNLSNKTIEFIKHPQIEMQTNPGLPSSGIVVQEGATLEVRNCILRGLNGYNRMWHGISVWGEEPKTYTTNTDNTIRNSFGNIGTTYQNQHQRTQDQDNQNQNLKEKDIQNRNSQIAGMNIKNGKLDIASSTIRDAHTGVSLYRNPMPFVHEQKEHGRGEIEARNVMFLNNRVSIGFRAFSLVSNKSKITNCTFSHTEPLLDENYYPDGRIGAFISLRNVKNPKILANTFIGNTNFPINKRGTAIGSFDASYIVESGTVGFIGNLEPNTFTNLSKGIDIYATGGSTSIRIKDNRFNNVYQGITANGSNFDEISFNEFNVPLGDSTFNSWGMFMQTSAGFMATENKIQANTANEYTFGTVARNVTNVNGEYYRNTFEGAFSVATQTEGAGNNRLSIDCNRYNSINTHDWAVLSDNMADQGICSAQYPDLVATNLFSTCEGESESQILSVAEFQYSSLDDFTPECLSGEILVELCQADGGVNFNDLCPQIVDNPCKSCGVIGVDPSDFANLPTGIIREHIRGVRYRELAQSGNIDQLIATLTKEALPEDRKILIPTYWQRKRYEEARKELNELPIETEADADFHRMFDVLVRIGEDNRYLHEINPSEEQVIRSVAESENETRVLAEAIVAEVDHTAYICYPKQLPILAKSWIDNNEEEAKTNKENIKVYPNPSESDVTIEFEEPKKVNVQLYDATGRLVRVFETSTEQKDYTIKGLSHGIYNLRLVDDKGGAESKRIMIR